MTTTNTFAVVFAIRQDKVTGGKVPVYARITVNGERTMIALKEKVDPRSWDERKGAGKGNKTEILSLNSHLLEVRTELGQCYRGFRIIPATYRSKNVFTK